MAPNPHVSHSFCMYLTAGLVWSVVQQKHYRIGVVYVVQQKQDGNRKEISQQLRNDLVQFHFLYAEVGHDAQAKRPEVGEDAGYFEELAAKFW
jgi:hypothetical protein